MRPGLLRRLQAGGVLLYALLILGGCESGEPALQNSAIDEGGVYEDGALERVQPVEPEVLDDSAAVPGAPEP